MLQLLRMPSCCAHGAVMRPSDLQGGVCFAYDPAAGATKFMVGCESGTVLACNRKAKNPIDRVAGAFSGHHGPVYSLHRHPFAAKYFLSVGDWTARIWAEDSKQPLITSRYHNTYLTGTVVQHSFRGSVVYLQVNLDPADRASVCTAHPVVSSHVWQR